MAKFTLVAALDPESLAELKDLSLTELRAKRDACAQLETGLSYLRRLAQARVDLIIAESERRLLGLSELDPEALIGQLPRSWASTAAEKDRAACPYRSSHPPTGNC